MSRPFPIVTDTGRVMKGEMEMGNELANWVARRIIWLVISSFLIGCIISAGLLAIVWL